MSNCNNWKFSKELDKFEKFEIIPLEMEIARASSILNDPNYQWKSEDQIEMAKAKFEKMKNRNEFLRKFYSEGKNLCLQHENLVNLMAKWYEIWREDISNEGVQETEILTAQADMLNQIFGEIYMELKDLNLNIKPPQALNLR